MSESATAGDRLADWLEGLGLADHLAEAGLPTYTRDDDGHAVWSQPDRVDELDRALRSQGDEPGQGVPVDLVALARQARLRRELARSPWFTYASLAEVRGASVDATRYAVHKAAQAHRLLLVPIEETTAIPAFQLDDAGEVRPEVAALLEPLLAAGMDPWRAWIWLTQPAALTFGVPPERAAADPETAEITVRAAERLAAQLSGGR